MREITIIKPTMEDLETVVGVENAAWPDIGDGMVAEVDKFMTRIELGLMYMLFLNQKPAGIISFQYPSFTDSQILNGLLKEFEQNHGLLKWDSVYKKYGLPKDWYEATNQGHITNGASCTHNLQSDCVFLIGVGVDCRLHGNGLVNHLISYTLKEAKKGGKRFVVGYGRLPQLHERGNAASLEDAEKHLLMKKPSTSLPGDYGARFHVFNGAKAISVIPNAMDDPESLNFGFLALYKL